MLSKAANTLFNKRRKRISHKRNTKKQSFLVRAKGDFSLTGGFGLAVAVYEAERITISLQRGSKEGLLGRKKFG